MLKKIFRLGIVLGLFISPLVFGLEYTNIVHGPLNISWCKDGKIYFEETSSASLPINFVLQCENSKTIVDRYYVDGANYFYSGREQKADMGIESVFFQKIQGKDNLFVLVKRHVTHRAQRINVDNYYTYIYKYNSQKIIQLNEDMMKDYNLNGDEGESNGYDVYFKYKTAAAIKKYINEKYNSQNSEQE